jgi:hypothetical protein
LKWVWALGTGHWALGIREWELEGRFFIWVREEGKQKGKKVVLLGRKKEAKLDNGKY